MASIWCLQSPAVPARLLSHREHLRPKKFKSLQVACFCVNREQPHENPSVGIENLSGILRRQVLFQATVAATSFPSIASLALANTGVAGDFRLYSDEAKTFTIMIPQDWQVGAGDTDGVRSVTGFFPEEPAKSNVTIVVTGLGADFTRLESFGKVDAFAENLVSGLDRSWQRPAGVKAKLIDSKAKNGLYYIEYTLQNPGESSRHLFAVLGMANNGVYNRLYTVTGQYVDEESEKYGSKIEKINMRESETAVDVLVGFGANAAYVSESGCWDPLQNCEILLDEEWKMFARPSSLHLLPLAYSCCPDDAVLTSNLPWLERLGYIRTECKYLISSKTPCNGISHLI